MTPETDLALRAFLDALTKLVAAATKKVEESK